MIDWKDLFKINVSSHTIGGNMEDHEVTRYELVDKVTNGIAGVAYSKEELDFLIKGVMEAKEKEMEKILLE